MAFTLIGSVSASSTNGNSVTTGSLDTTGANLVVVVFSSYQGGTIVNVTDNKSNTYSNRTVYQFSGDSRVRLSYVASPSVGTGHTFTVSGSGIYPALAVA